MRPNRIRHVYIAQGALGVTVGWLLEGEGATPRAKQIRDAVAAARARYAADHPDAATGTDDGGA